MRIKEFFIRLGLFIPFAFWVTFLFMMLIGIIASFLGAGSFFYCTIYCKLAVIVFISLVAAIVLCQFKACCKKETDK
jgi:uncharacterized membrane protein YkvI